MIWLASSQYDVHEVTCAQGTVHDEVLNAQISLQGEHWLTVAQSAEEKREGLRDCHYSVYIQYLCSITHDSSCCAR